jgi:transposase
MSNPIPYATRREVAELIAAGKTYREVAEITGVRLGSIRGIVKRTPLGRRREPTSVERRARFALARTLAEKRGEVQEGPD